MIIVAGQITVEPGQRESYLADSVNIVEQGRAKAGCLDMAIGADLVDPGRINIFERWESQAALDAARGGGPGGEQDATIRAASVADYDIANVRPFFEQAAP